VVEHGVDDDIQPPGDEVFENAGGRHMYVGRAYLDRITYKCRSTLSSPGSSRTRKDVGRAPTKPILSIHKRSTIPTRQKSYKPTP
jgi:hypothetical protein